MGILLRVASGAAKQGKHAPYASSSSSSRRAYSKSFHFSQQLPPEGLAVSAARILPSTALDV